MDPDRSMQAKTDHPVNKLIAARWSPYSFDAREVDEADLLSIFEAARWAPSCFNEQPWIYIVATSSDAREFERMLSCLTEGNQLWASHAPVLALGIAKLFFDYDGRPNRSAFHDLGLASANLSLEATARGIAVHQMIGIQPERARSEYAIPEGYEPLTGIAIGYSGRPEDAPERFRDRDLARRPRKPLEEFLFGASFGKPSGIIR